MTVSSPPVPNAVNHGSSHCGDWNGVADGVRRQSASHSGASASSSSRVEMTSAGKARALYSTTSRARTLLRGFPQDENRDLRTDGQFLLGKRPRDSLASAFA